MASTNKIQIRRGNTQQWTDADTALRYLSEGELGYDTDLKRFKIGQGDNKPWIDHPWAGGFEPIAQTGIGLTFNSSTNAYSFYSYITGVVNGQDGITFETLPISGLLNDINASGTYYRIGLSTKLENFHDSSISVSGNLISSSGAVDGTGITISGFNNSAISLNPFGGTVSASGINIRNLTNSITVTEAVGGLAKGTVLSNASGITDVLKKMLEKIFEPTVGQPPGVTMGFSGPVNPAGSLASFSANASARYEVGTTGNITISSNLVQGFVAGTGEGAGWVSDGNQGVRAGIATAYSRTFNSNTNTDFNTNNTLNSYAVVLGPNSASATITHASGITPKNSLGVNSTTLTVLAAGGTVTGTASFTGVRRLFCGYDTTASAPTTSSDVRSLPNVGATFESSKSIWDYGVNTVLRMTIPVGTKRVIVAVPVDLYGLGDTITVVDETSLNSDITSSYNRTAVSVSGANAAAAVTYYVYSFIPAGPFSNVSTHKLTLK